MKRLGLVILGLGLAVRADDTELSADLRARIGTVVLSQPRRVTLLDAAPEGVELPPDLEEPRFGVFPAGDGQVVIAMTDKRFWIDRDMDGNLREERPRHWLGEERRYRSALLRIPRKGRPPLGLQVVVTFHVGKDPKVYVTNRSYLFGSAVMGKRVRRLAIADTNSNFRFGDKDDWVFVDLDGDGDLDVDEDSHERLKVGDAFRVRDEGYRVRLGDTLGTRLLLAPVRPLPPLRLRRRKVEEPKPGAVAPKGGDFDRLVAELKKYRRADPLLRGYAVRKIGESGHARAFEILLDLYRTDRSKRVKAIAIRSMGCVAYRDRANEPVKIARWGKETAFRVAAIEALYGMGARAALEQICKELLLKTRDEDVARAAARHLAYLQTDGARAQLLEASLELSRLRHRYHAYYFATRLFAAPPAREHTLAAAASAEPRLAALGLSDLHFYGWPEARTFAIEALREKVERERALVLVEILGAAGDGESVRALLPLCTQPWATAKARFVDLVSLVRDPTGIAVVAEAVAAPDPDVREVLVEIAARIPDPVVTDALVAQLGKEKDPALLRQIVRALGHHRSPRAGAALVALAKKRKKDEELRRPLVRALADIGAEVASIRDYFAKHLRSARWEDRVIAIDAAARAGAVALAPLVIENLAHDEWQVRVAAAQALRIIRVKEAIDPLIERLEKDESRRVRRDVRETLESLTGQLLLDRADLWKKWWTSHKSAFVIVDPSARRKRGKHTGERRSVARFYGVPIESDRVVFVIDQSGSMDAELDVAVEEVLNVVKRLDDHAEINVVFFDHNIHPWRKRLTRLTKSNRKALEKHLRRQVPQGATNLFGALAVAIDHDGVDTICVLSDGAPTDGKYIADDEILREIRKLNELRRISIHTVSIGMSSNLLKKLARQNGGRYTEKTR